jgi:hypothetical protein
MYTAYRYFPEDDTYAVLYRGVVTMYDFNII